MPCTLYAAQYNAVIVADMDSGRVLYQENSNDLNYPASLTKIMTLYLTFDALEHGRLRIDHNLIVSKAASDAKPVKLGLSAGSKISVDNAIKAVAVHSANDVARVLAENLTGDEGDFASLMTRVAKEIGLSRTNFENSSGLPDDDHLSSARDIALMSMAVYKHFPQYWRYFSVKSFTFAGKTYSNTNTLLGSYPGCDGMKTGFTNRSRYSLVATARRGGRHIMSVVLGAQTKQIRTEISRKMLDRGFATLGIKEDLIVDISPSESEFEGEDENYYQSGEDVEIVKSVPVKSVSEPKVKSYVAKGNSGIQFGAFSSKNAAESQQSKIKSLFGVTTYLEKHNGMWRVRVQGITETKAQGIKSKCAGAGIECYIFH